MFEPQQSSSSEPKIVTSTETEAIENPTGLVEIHTTEIVPSVARMVTASAWLKTREHNWTYLTSLAEFGSSPFQDGGNKTPFPQIEHIFSD